MDNFQIFQEATHLIRRNKFAWLYICISFFNLFIPSAQSINGNLLLLCVSFLISLSSLLLLLILPAGFVYDISQKHLNHEDSSISVGWSQGIQRIKGILGLYFLAVIPILLIYASYWIITHKFFSPVSVAGLVIQLFFVPLFDFGLCAVVIDNVKATASVSASLLLIRKNFSRVMLLSGLCILIEKVLLVLLLAIISIPFPLKLSFPINLDFATYINMVQVPIVVLSNQVLSAIIYPWEVAIFTIAYLNFKKEASDPVLVQTQPAA